MLCRQPYIGRFAPSPSGPLHLGSLVCALASFLDAKANHGRWLVRIEDIDPPREMPGASDLILSALDHHGLQWDGELIYQSARSEAYHEILQLLLNEKLAYHCKCSRKRLAELKHVYNNACRNKQLDDSRPTAIRLNTEKCLQQIASKDTTIVFEDAIQGQTREDFSLNGDFVIHRKDGLFAYQLAVVVDDIMQGITHVVRGSDLLETTAKQILLMQVLHFTPPHYAHIPVINNAAGLKLSKQNHAPAIDCDNASHNLVRCLRYLNQSPPHELSSAACHTILAWAIEHWDRNKIPQCLAITQ